MILVYPNRVSTYLPALSGSSFTVPGPLRTKRFALL